MHYSKEMTSFCLDFDLNEIAEALTDRNRYNYEGGCHRNGNMNEKLQIVCISNVRDLHQ